MIEVLQRKRQKESILQFAQPKPLFSQKHRSKKNLLSAEKLIVQIKTFSDIKDEDLDEKDG